MLSPCPLLPLFLWFLVLSQLVTVSLFLVTEEWCLSVFSVHLRTVSILSARALLAGAYRAYLWSIRLVLWRHFVQDAYKPRQGDRTVAIFELKIVSLLVPTLFLEYLRRFNDTNRRIKVTVEDVPRRLVSARSVFKIRAGDRPVKNRQNSVFAIYFLTRRCLWNRRGENKEHHPLLLWYS